MVVVTVSLGMNGYVMARLCRLWGARRGRWFYGRLLLLSISPIAALVLESRIGNGLTGACFTLAMTWLGLCWLLLWILLVQQVLAPILPLPRPAWAVGVCGLACCLALFAAVNARWVTIRREQIPQLPLRIAHLSDIHIGSIGPSVLADIIAATNAFTPDLVLITGDLFDNANPKSRAPAARLAALTAPVVLTSGNHEAYTGYDNVRQMLAGTGIRWLRNDVLEFKSIRIIGVDNSFRADILRSVLDRAAPSPAFTILMNHQPIGFDIAAQHGIGLTLSGHVHNGQLWPFNYVVGVFYPYLKGLHREAGAYLNVSTGTGIWGPPLRLGSHSEVVLLEPLPRT
ncbi:MAG TPA: metallophosphoesterase [Candidatus Methylomirabilis sp.]|nr:metallophosphoesterase [Candidatus Methylomirabilis sp.]